MQIYFPEISLTFIIHSAPRAQFIPAWGIAPGFVPPEKKRAEGPLYRPVWGEKNLDRKGLQPLIFLICDSWGDAPGCYEKRLWRKNQQVWEGGGEAIELILTLFGVGKLICTRFEVSPGLIVA